LQQVSAPLQEDGSPSDEAAAKHIASALSKGSHVFEWRHRRPDDGDWDAEVHLMSFQHGKRTLLQFSLQDITERKRAEDKLEQLAFFDTLTGLPNRALLLDRLQQTLAASQRQDQPVTLLFLDLDRFKEINDTLGHSIGDGVLKGVARRLQGVLRQEESMARIGGDEFVVVAAGADQMASALVAERLIAALGEPIEVRGHRFAQGVSIGIAQFPHDGATPELLLRHADVAMYGAKSAGSGYRFYRPEMSEGLAERMALARDLKAALQKGRAELELYFQPQVDLRGGELIGAEALMRWHRPGREPIGPAVFVPIAEERGMMGELGAWVLQHACQQLNTWQAEGLRLPGRLAVNIAAQQIESPDFPDQALGIVRNAGLSPAQFELELTESGLMHNVELAINIAGRLKAAGFAMAIDDFGTGYSSLAYLKRLPANKVKIDMSFVRDMLVDRNDHAIVTTIIAMGRTLDLRTIAEGVETLQQAEALLALGCDEAQGYYFGRPEPAAIFARKWLGC
jgi:diguanylate cyclase (GGDEF)-like protein